MCECDIKRAEDLCEDEEDKASIIEWRNSPDRAAFLLSLNNRSREQLVEDLIYQLWQVEDLTAALSQSLGETDRWRAFAKNFKSNAEHFNSLAEEAKASSENAEVDNGKRRADMDEGRKKANLLRRQRAMERDEKLRERIREIGIDRLNKVIKARLKEDADGLRGLTEKSFDQKVDQLIAALRQEGGNGPRIS